MPSKLTLAMLAAAAATAASAQSVNVVVETSHGGAGKGLINTTIAVPVNTIYRDSALDAVSTLYLTQAARVDLASVTCTPFKNADGTGNAGLPFNSTSPSFIATNTVQIGSVVCIVPPTAGTTAQPASSSGAIPVAATPIYSNTTTTTVHNTTSIVLTTVHPSPHVSPSTVTSVATFSGANGPTTSTFTSVVHVPAPTTTASARLNSQGAAPSNGVGRWLAGAAAAGLGLAAAL